MHTALKIIFLAVGVSVVTTQETIDLSFPIDAVTEGDGVITVQCTISSGIPISNDVVCELEVVPGLISPAENEYDVGDVTLYSCTITNGDTTGTVDIPLVADLVWEEDEVLGVKCKSTDSVEPGSWAEIVIHDNGEGEAITLGASKHKYLVREGDSLFINLHAYDFNGTRVPMEEDVWLEPNMPSQFTSDTATFDEDFDPPKGPPIVLGSVNGHPRMSFRIGMPVTDDPWPENLETLILVLAGISISNRTRLWPTTFDIRVQDNDKPEVFILNGMSAVRRKSKDHAGFLIFTNDYATIDGFEPRTIPSHLREYESKERIFNNGAVGHIATIPGNIQKSARRFNEYMFWLTLTINANEYNVAVVTYLSSTEVKPRTRKNKDKDSRTTRKIPHQPRTITVVPFDRECTRLAGDHSIIAPFNPMFMSQFRWRFVSAHAGPGNVKLLSKYNSKGNIRINHCDQAGLYMVARGSQGFKRGKMSFVRVIIADCPAGYVHSNPGVKDCAMQSDTVCWNGGMVDPTLDLCSCMPGFAGVHCEIALPPGNFGSNNQYRIRDFVHRNRAGRGQLISMGFPIGDTCFAGWMGERCDEVCTSGTFGAGCGLQCHCSEGKSCNPWSGMCENDECALFYQGTNCQQGGGPPRGK